MIKKWKISLLSMAYRHHLSSALKEHCRRRLFLLEAACDHLTQSLKKQKRKSYLSSTLSLDTHTANGVSGAYGYSGPEASGVSGTMDYSNHVYGNIAGPRWQGTVANRSVPTTLPLTSQISLSESTKSCKSKADEWLETALKSSISPTSPVAQQNWSAMSSLGSFENGVPTQQYQVAPQVDLLDLSTPVEQQPSTSFRYSAPPTQAPPPLPSRSVVVNNKPVPSVGSSLDAFGQPVNWEAPVPGAPQRPEDPFDVQWSLRALSTNNPFSSKA